MCGIAGILNFNTAQSYHDVMNLMLETIKHRGPDDTGIWKDDIATLGHKRLSIIDLSQNGNQPIHSHDGRYTLVYNGEVYNYPEIKKQLGKYPFQSDTDSEVVLAAFAEWGPACLQKFNGMFAFAIWDRQQQELTLVRDRIGIKPLYYSLKDHQFVFSSEIRAIIKSGIINKVINYTGLQDYMRYGTVHAPNTILEDVQMLLPGQYAVIRKEGMQTSVYWDPSEKREPEMESNSYEQVTQNVRTLFTQSVERRLKSDVPFGVFLSGGIDSSAILAAVSQLTPERPNAFSIDFSEKKFSEIQYAKMVAGKYNANHEILQLRPDDFLGQLPEMLKSLDHPSGDGINSYVISKFVADQGYKVALSGTGGDEVFAGYPTIFRRMERIQKLQWLWNIPYGLRSLIGKMVSIAKPGTVAHKFEALLKQDDASFANTFPVLRQLILDQRISELLGKSKKELDTNAVKLAINQWNGVTDTMPSISRTSIAEIWFYLQNVLLRDIDQMSMSQSLEVRVPFLDHKLVEYVLSLPNKYKQLDSPKKLLVDALGDMLPDEIVNRPKAGFYLPWPIWMKGEIREFCETRIQALAHRPFFNRQSLLNHWSDFLNGRSYITWERIWHLVVLEDWLVQNDIDTSYHMNAPEINLTSDTLS